MAYPKSRSYKPKEYTYDIEGNQIPLDLGLMPDKPQKGKSFQEPINNMLAYRETTNDYKGPAKGKGTISTIKYLPLPTKPKESRLRWLPTEEEKLEALIEAFILWAHSEEAWDIDEFPVQYGLAPYHFRHHNGSEFWHQAFDLAKTLIALRLKRRMRELNFSGYFHKMLPLLDDNYAAYERSIKDKDSNTGSKTKIDVHFDAVPDHAWIPNKNKPRDTDV